MGLRVRPRCEAALAGGWAPTQETHPGTTPGSRLGRRPLTHLPARPGTKRSPLTRKRIMPSAAWEEGRGIGWEGPRHGTLESRCVSLAAAPGAVGGSEAHRANHRAWGRAWDPAGCVGTSRVPESPGSGAGGEEGNGGRPAGQAPQRAGPSQVGSSHQEVCLSRVRAFPFIKILFI